MGGPLCKGGNRRGAVLEADSHERLSEGGGISCNLNCTPTQEFLSGFGFAGPAFVVAGSLAVGWQARPLGRVGTLTIVIIAAAVALALLAVAFA